MTDIKTELDAIFASEQSEELKKLDIMMLINRVGYEGWMRGSEDTSRIWSKRNEELLDSKID